MTRPESLHEVAMTARQHGWTMVWEHPAQIGWHRSTSDGRTEEVSVTYTDGRIGTARYLLGEVLPNTQVIIPDVQMRIAGKSILARVLTHLTEKEA
jgi:hypothetical protein